MKRFIMACVLVLLFVGGSEAVASQQSTLPNVILKYGQVARIGNTIEVCAASRVGYTLNSGPKKIAPYVACWPSKKGPPVVGSHANVAAWLSGNLVVGPAQWLQAGSLIYLSWTVKLPSDWKFETHVDSIIWMAGKSPSKMINSAQQASWTIGFPVAQGKRNREVRLKEWDSFAPEGAEKGFACDVLPPGAWSVKVPYGTTTTTYMVSCNDLRVIAQETASRVYLSGTFWEPWGTADLQFLERNTDPNCVNSEGTLGCGPQVIYPYP